MQNEPPDPISEPEQQARQARVEAIARRLGFIGRIEYRHVATSSGGAQYGIGPTSEQDVLAYMRRRSDATPQVMIFRWLR
jgi:hypothetical protein